MDFELADWAGVQFFLYAAERAAPDYPVGSLTFYRIEESLLSRLPTSMWIVFSHFIFYKVVERTRMDLVFVSLAPYSVTEVDWTSFGGSDDFVV